MISVLGNPSMTARRQPQAHSACPTGGERVGAASTSLRLRFAVPTVTARHRQLRRLAGGRGLYLHWLLGVGKQREDAGYEQLSVSLSQRAKASSISCTCRLHAVFYWPGLRESSGVEATHTWTGDALGRGPYQAVTALNSLRYRLGRYPVVARRCLASTPLDTVAHQAGRRWHSDSDPAT